MDLIQSQPGLRQVPGQPELPRETLSQGGKKQKQKQLGNGGTCL